MKIEGLSVPPTLQEQFDKLFTKQVKAIENPTFLRTATRALKTELANEKRKRTKAYYFKRAIGYLAAYYGRPKKEADDTEWRAARLQELLDKEPSLNWWQKTTPYATTYRNSQAIATPDPDPPPYAYRVQSNLPTTTEWLTGTSASAPMRYEGTLLAGYFCDQSMTWVNMTFKMPKAVDNASKWPVLLRLKINITAVADARSSRPMFSYTYKVTAHTSNPGTYGEGVPPTQDAKHYYHKYRGPLGTPPYYDGYLATDEFWLLFSKAELIGKQWVLLQLAPRGMRGKGQNNNETVTITATVEAELYTPHYSTVPWRKPCFRYDGATVALLNDDLESVTTWDLSTATKESWEGPGNWDEQINATANTVTITTDYEVLGRVYRPTNYYYSYANRADVAVLGSHYQGAIVNQGRVSDGQGGYNLTITYTVGQSGETTIATGSEAAITPYIAFPFVGGFSNGMILDASGRAMNLHFSSVTYPTTEKDIARAIVWNSVAYLQDIAGQWWQFDAPTDAGGTFSSPVPGNIWEPTNALGDIVTVADRPWPSAQGIMWYRGPGQTSSHYMLTWSGALREINITVVEDQNYLGTV